MFTAVDLFPLTYFLSEVWWTNRSAMRPVEDVAVTFRVVKGGSSRGKDKLVDSTGYSYTVKVTQMFIHAIFTIFYPQRVHPC